MFTRSWKEETPTGFNGIDSKFSCYINFKIQKNKFWFFNFSMVLLSGCLAQSGLLIRYGENLHVNCLVYRFYHRPNEFFPPHLEKPVSFILTYCFSFLFFLIPSLLDTNQCLMKVIITNWPSYIHFNCHRCCL